VQAISIKLHDAGYNLVVTLTPGNPNVQSWLDRMKAAGRNFRAYAVDVADYNACQAAMAKILAEVGRIDILINITGITRDMDFRKMDKVNWDAVVRTNLDSVLNVTKALSDGMVERGWELIVNISSINGSKDRSGGTHSPAVPPPRKA
jgi:acetoacetyl-CoA reductase